MWIPAKRVHVESRKMTARCSKGEGSPAGRMKRGLPAVFAMFEWELSAQAEASRRDAVEHPAEGHRLITQSAGDHQLLTAPGGFIRQIDAFLDRGLSACRLKAPAFAGGQLEERPTSLAREPPHSGMDMEARGEGETFALAPRSAALQPVFASQRVAVRRQRQP